MEVTFVVKYYKTKYSVRKSSKQEIRDIRATDIAIEQAKYDIQKEYEAKGYTGVEVKENG